MLRSLKQIRIINNTIFGLQLQSSISKPSKVEVPLCPTIMLNIVNIHALRKTSALPKPLRKFLVRMAVSDLGVGLFGQPLYIAYLAV